MIRYELIDLVNEEAFRKEFHLNTDLIYKDGSYYIEVDELTEAQIEKLLTANHVRFIKMNVKEREYNGYKITIAESSQFYYINFNTGLGDGIYDKADWTLDDAIEDQKNIFNR